MTVIRKCLLASIFAVPSIESDAQLIPPADPVGSSAYPVGKTPFPNTFQPYMPPQSAGQLKALPAIGQPSGQTDGQPFGMDTPYPRGTGAPGISDGYGSGTQPTMPPVAPAAPFPDVVTDGSGLTPLGGGAGVGEYAQPQSFASATTLAPVMGDMSPHFFRARLASLNGPGNPNLPPGPPQYPRSENNPTGGYFSPRGFKIADNMNVEPVDRVYASFNYFANVNKEINVRERSQIDRVTIYHQLYGLEKTFFDRWTSIGLRLPVNTLTLESQTATQYDRTSTSFQNLSIYLKSKIIEGENGDMLVGGLALDTPTGPSTFAGFPGIVGENTFEIQPFIGYIKKSANESLYLQGLYSIGIPMNSQMPTVMFIDNQLGYYLYRSQDRSSFLSAIVPSYELHLNIPVNHSNWDISDPYGYGFICNMTWGVNMLFADYRGVLTMGYATPVSGPRPFDGEFLLQFNWRFGGGSQRDVPPTLMPPTF